MSHTTFALEVITIEKAGPDSVLKQKASPIVFPLNQENAELIQTMKKMLYERKGVGLAAPQVNKNKSIVVIYIPESAKLLRDNATTYPMHVLINPSDGG